MTGPAAPGAAVEGLPVEFGLFEVAGSASLTLVFFPALVLLAVLGVRFGYYAHRNRRAAEVATETPIWRYLLYVGLLAALFGALGVVEIVSSVRTPYRSTVMLTMVLVLAGTVRRIHDATTEDGRASPTDRFARLAFVAVLLAHLAGVALAVSPQALAALEGTGGLAFMAYGATYYHAQISRARLQGTMIDSLLRHLLPVLTFAGLVNVTALAYGLGLVDPNVVPHIQVVFIVMTASTLMTATIKLRQNLAGL